MLLGKRLFGVIAAIAMLLCASASAAEYQITAPATVTIDTSANFTCTGGTKAYSEFKVVWGDGAVSSVFYTADLPKTEPHTYRAAERYTPTYYGRSAATPTWESLDTASFDVVPTGDKTQGLRISSPVYGTTISTKATSVTFETTWRMALPASSGLNNTAMVWINTNGATNVRSITDATTIAWGSAAMPTTNPSTVKIFTPTGAYSVSGSIETGNNTFSVGATGMDLTGSDYQVSVTGNKLTGVITVTLTSLKKNADGSAAGFAQFDTNSIQIGVTWGGSSATTGNGEYGDYGYSYAATPAITTPYYVTFAAPATSFDNATVTALEALESNPTFTTFDPAAATPSAPQNYQLVQSIIAGDATTAAARVGAGITPAAVDALPNASASFKAKLKQYYFGKYANSSTAAFKLFNAAPTAGQAAITNGGSFAPATFGTVSAEGTVDTIIVSGDSAANGVMLFRMLDSDGAANAVPCHNFQNNPISLTLSSGSPVIHLDDMGNPTPGGALAASTAANSGANAYGVYTINGSETNVTCLQFSGVGPGGSSDSEGGSSGCEMSSTGSAWALLPVALVLGALALIALRRKEA